MRIGANAMTDRCYCIRPGNWFLFSQPGTVAGTVQTRNAGGRVSLFARNTTRSACGRSNVTQCTYKVTHPFMSFLRGRVRVPQRSTNKRGLGISCETRLNRLQDWSTCYPGEG